jgi:ABC-type amino acid transport substrate-binding protein
LGFRSKAGTPTGIHVDILAALSKKTGVPIQVRIVPKARLLNELEKGEVDGAILYSTDRIAALATDGGVTDETSLVALGRVGTPLKTHDDLMQAGILLVMPETQLGAPFDADLRQHKYPVHSSPYREQFKWFADALKAMTHDGAIDAIFLKYEGDSRMALNLHVYR